MADQLHERLAAALRQARCTALFGLPGGGPNLDVVGAALEEGIDFVLAHGETEAAIMASTYGLLTGTPGAVIATRGPGATSLANGVAQATLDRFPLVAIADTVPGDQSSRVAHQRVDQRSFFAPISKSSATIGQHTSVQHLTELINESTVWPYGAVHLDYDPSDTTPPPDGSEERLVREPSAADIAAAAELLAGAVTPVVVLGGEAAPHAAALRPLLEQAGAPVLTTYHAVGAVPTEGLLHAGLFTNGKLESGVLGDADVIVTIGLDLVEPIPQPWSYDAPVIRVSAVDQVDDYLPAAVDLVGAIESTCGQLFAGVVTGAGRAESTYAAEEREAGRRQIRECELAPFGPTTLVDAVAKSRPQDVIATVDAGAHFLAVMPLWSVDRPYGLLISNGLATMGFAVPAAIGAAMATPGCPVIAFTGDGGMSMVLAELETIARLQLPITVVVFNDATLSLIKIKQTAQHGGDRSVGYAPVDFAQIAEASGLRGVVVTSVDELDAELAQAEWDQPRVIDARIDPAAYPAIIEATRGTTTPDAPAPEASPNG